MLTSLRTVREISRSSILAEQGRLIAYPNWPLKKSNSESHTLRHIWRPWMSFRLGWLISPLWVCLRRKSRIAARIAGPVVILCALPGFASAACPVGLITNATATLANGDNCPAGLQAGTGGIIDVPSGATVTIGPAGTTASNGGKIIFDGAANISTNAPIRSVQADGATSLINGMTRPTITATGLIGDPSAAVYAVNGGQIELANGFVATGTGINASTVTADGVGSFVDATHGSQIIMNVDPAGNNNSEAVQMLRGGLVKLDATTILQAVGPQAAGLKIDGTTVPLGTMDGLTVNVVGDPNSTDDALGVWATNQVSGVAVRRQCRPPDRHGCLSAFPWSVHNLQYDQCDEQQHHRQRRGRDRRCGGAERRHDQFDQFDTDLKRARGWSRPCAQPIRSKRHKYLHSVRGIDHEPSVASPHRPRRIVGCDAL